MSFISWIVESLRGISNFFYDIFLEVRGWIFPFYLAAPFFYEICWLFYYLAKSFSDFGEWVDDAASKLEDILTWSNIRSLILSWIPNLQPVITWWQNWTTWVGQAIDDWWQSIKSTVQGWIDIATQGFDDLVVAWDNFWTATFPYWTSKLDGLKAAWDNFWTVTFPTLVSFSWLTEWWGTELKDIGSLINSRIKEWMPFWAGWQDVKDNVIEFITDPLEWLLGKFTDWFLGPEA